LIFLSDGERALHDRQGEYLPEGAICILDLFHVPVLSGRMYMSCRQAEQPVGGGLNLFLGDPGT
jgi:hypothetical protein